MSLGENGIRSALRAARPVGHPHGLGCAGRAGGEDEQEEVLGLGEGCGRWCARMGCPPRRGDQASRRGRRARRSMPRSRPSTRCDWVRVGDEELAVGVADVAWPAPRPGGSGSCRRSTAPARAAAVRRKKYSGVFSSRTPTWKGPGRRRSSSSAARALASATTCRQVHSRPSKRSPTSSSPTRRMTRSPGTRVRSAVMPRRAVRHGPDGSGTVAYGWRAKTNAADTSVPIAHSVCVGRIVVDRSGGRHVVRLRHLSIVRARIAEAALDQHVPVPESVKVCPAMGRNLQL